MNRIIRTLSMLGGVAYLARLVARVGGAAWRTSRQYNVVSVRDGQAR